MGYTVTGGGNTHDRVSQTFTYVDSGASPPNYHLASNDAGAKDYGVSDPGSGLFSDDIDSETRSNHSWDIGADEAAEKIYRSVGPSASTYLERGIDGGGNNLNISGSTATFASDLGTDVGVGDVIQYDDDNDGDIDANDSVAFIHARASATSFTVKNSLGGTPTATLAADQDWSIFRSYDSLSHAESGDENDSIDDDLEAFENWSAGKDIVTSNEQWNIACYANGSTTDQTAVTINDWTTGVNNYIKVYTPTETTEVGTTQRHSGVWSDTKYRLDFSDNWAYVINCAANYARFEGLQMHNSHADGYGFAYSGAGELYFSHNILQGSPATIYQNSVNLDTMGISTVRIWNNILYDLRRGIYFGYGTAGSIFIIHNNTIIDMTNIGISIEDNVGDASVYLKNNLVFNTNDDYYVSNFTTQDYDYNMGEDAAFTGDANYIQTTQVGATIFKDYNSDDFHLSSSNDAKDAGTDLSSDSNLSFSDDIDGDSRPSPYWDIGADEYPASRKVRFEGDFKMEGSFTIE